MAQFTRLADNQLVMAYGLTDNGKPDMQYCKINRWGYPTAPRNISKARFLQQYYPAGNAAWRVMRALPAELQAIVGPRP